jgi:transposase
MKPTQYICPDCGARFHDKIEFVIHTRDHDLKHTKKGAK